MGDIFGGGGGQQGQGSFLPNQPFNIPGEQALLPSAIWRAQSQLPYTTLPQRTMDFGHGAWDPASMGMHLPQFNPQQQQQGQMNPFLAQKQLPLGAYNYMPPYANTQISPGGNAGQMAPFMYGGPPQQQQQGQPQGQPPQQALAQAGQNTASSAKRQGGTA